MRGLLPSRRKESTDNALLKSTSVSAADRASEKLGGRNEKFERKVWKQNGMTSKFGDWKLRVWKKSQYRSFSI